MSLGVAKRTDLPSRQTSTQSRLASNCKQPPPLPTTSSASQPWKSTPAGPSIHLNGVAKTAIVDVRNLTVVSEILSFYRRLPHYRETCLHSLPSAAADLHLSHVFVKDESNCFGLPSFQILGASWAVFRALAERVSLDHNSLIDHQQDAASLWTRLSPALRTARMA